MAKKITIWLLIVVVAFTSVFSFIRLNTGDIVLGYPLLIADIFTHAPDGSDMNQKNISDRFINDLETMTLSYVPSVIGKLQQNNGQLKRSECFSTLEQCIYFVQASIRFFQGSYGKTNLDDPYRWDGNTTISMSFTDLGGNRVLYPFHVVFEGFDFYNAYNSVVSLRPYMAELSKNRVVRWNFDPGDSLTLPSFKPYVNPDSLLRWWNNRDQPHSFWPYFFKVGDSKDIRIIIVLDEPDLSNYSISYDLNGYRYTHHWSDGDLIIDGDDLLNGNNALKFIFTRED